jgi:hypothetical protein
MKQNIQADVAIVNLFVQEQDMPQTLFIGS